MSSTNATTLSPLNFPNSNITSLVNNSTNLYNMMTPGGYELRHINILAINANGLNIIKKTCIHL